MGGGGSESKKLNDLLFITYESQNNQIMPANAQTNLFSVFPFRLPDPICIETVIYASVRFVDDKRLSVHIMPYKPYRNAPIGAVNFHKMETILSAKKKNTTFTHLFGLIACIPFHSRLRCSLGLCLN